MKSFYLSRNPFRSKRSRHRPPVAQPRLGIETLEDRSMLSATVDVATQAACSPITVFADSSQAVVSANGNQNGIVNQSDYLVWRVQQGECPAVNLGSATPPSEINSLSQSQGGSNAASPKMPAAIDESAILEPTSDVREASVAQDGTGTASPVKATSPKSDGTFVDISNPTMVWTVGEPQVDIEAGARDTQGVPTVVEAGNSGTADAPAQGLEVPERQDVANESIDVALTTTEVAANSDQAAPLNNPLYVGGGKPSKLATRGRYRLNAVTFEMAAAQIVNETNGGFLYTSESPTRAVNDPVILPIPFLRLNAVEGVYPLFELIPTVIEPGFKGGLLKQARHVRTGFNR